MTVTRASSFCRGVVAVFIFFKATQVDYKVCVEKSHKSKNSFKKNKVEERIAFPTRLYRSPFN